MSSLLKRQVYAGIMEILRDKKYYYTSSASPSYNQLTPAGVDELAKYVSHMGGLMLTKEKQELEQLAKDMTWNSLKKD